MLKVKTVGIIGYGNIAKALISRLAGWDARILVSNRSKLPSPPGVAHCDLDTLIAESDIVLPLLPLTPATYTLLSRTRLLAVKSGEILITPSPCAIVDEAPLAHPPFNVPLCTIPLHDFTPD